MKVSVVIPVYNGELYLAEVLNAVQAQQTDVRFDVLVIDSGSTDRSVEIARAAGVRLRQIPNHEFGHGKTRNLAVEMTDGDLIAFLTQDATPASDRWLSAYVDAFTNVDKLAAAYGPHIPRPEATPIMARLLTDFFASFSPDGRRVVHRPGGIPYLSNTNSCIARTAWSEVRFRDIEYAEDHAFGEDVLAAGWNKAFEPAAGVIHSHQYDLVTSFRRYFDEYRGLRNSVGEKTEASTGKVFAILRRSVRADWKWLRESGHDRALYWGAYSVIYHAGRILFGGLGARADRLPAAVRRTISLEGSGHGIHPSA